MEYVSVRSNERKLLSIPEVAQHTGLGRSTLLKEMYAGRLRSVKVGARRLVHPDDLNEWIDHLREQRDRVA